MLFGGGQQSLTEAQMAVRERVIESVTYEQQGEEKVSSTTAILKMWIR